MHFHNKKKNRWTTRSDRINASVLLSKNVVLTVPQKKVLLMYIICYYLNLSKIKCYYLNLKIYETKKNIYERDD